MDPNTALGDIAVFLRNVEHGEPDGLALDLACQDLYDWLDRGGFEPNWDQWPIASSYYRCRAVHHRNGERVEEEAPEYTEAR